MQKSLYDFSKSLDINIYSFRKQVLIIKQSRMLKIPSFDPVGTSYQRLCLRPDPWEYESERIDIYHVKEQVKSS